MSAAIDTPALATPASRVIPTSFMVNLRNKWVEDGIAESTAKLYITNLVILNNGKAFKSAIFLKNNYDFIMTFLETKADATRSTYLSAVLKTLAPMKDENIYKTVFNKYNEEMGLVSRDRKALDPAEKSQTQLENWIDWPDVEKKCSELKEKVMTFADSRSSVSDLTEREWSSLLDWIVLGCYCYMKNGPRRNKDFLEMLIYQEEPKTDLDKKKNYYITDGESGEFIFNTFKTSKFEGQKIIEATPEMVDMMNIWIKFHPLNIKKTLGRKKAGQATPILPMFVNHQGNPLETVNFITLRLNKIFKKKVGASMLRHSFLTYKFGDIVEEMKEVSEGMSHTIEQQREYIKK
jgi:integrase